MYYSDNRIDGITEYEGKPLGICKTCTLGGVWCGSVCEAKDKEIHEKYHNWMDEFGNTKMRKWNLTKEEEEELDDYLNRWSYMGDYLIYEMDRQHLAVSAARNRLSEIIFEETGVKKPVTWKEVQEWEVKNNQELFYY